MRPPDPNGPDHRRQRPRRKGRVFGYFVLVVNVLFLAWLVGIVLGAAEDPEGNTIIAVLVLAFWAVVDVILGVIYLVVRDRR